MDGKEFMERLANLKEYFFDGLGELELLEEAIRTGYEEKVSANQDSYQRHEAQGKVCNQCCQWLPLTEFNKNALAKDGLRNYCKTCGRTYGRRASTRVNHNPVNRTPVRANPAYDGWKKCNRCNQWKKVELFYVDRAQLDDLKPSCKVCQQARNKELRDERRRGLR